MELKPPAQGRENPGHHFYIDTLDPAWLLQAGLASFLPTGIAEHPGLHPVPLRIAVENGLLAALVWIGVTGYVLWRWPGQKTVPDCRGEPR